MAQFDVHRLNGGLVVDLQADLLDGLSTRVVAPLLPLRSFRRPVKRLNPLFEIQNQKLVLAPQYMAAVAVTELGQPIATVGDRRHEIVDAVDVVLLGV